MSKKIFDKDCKVIQRMSVSCCYKRIQRKLIVLRELRPKLLILLIALKPAENSGMCNEIIPFEKLDFHNFDTLNTFNTLVIFKLKRNNIYGYIWFFQVTLTVSLLPSFNVILVIQERLLSVWKIQ